MSSALDARLGRCTSLARPGCSGGSLKGFFSTSCKDAVERELVLLRRPLRWRGKASLPGPWTATACTRLLSAAAERPSFNLAALALLRPNGHGMSRMPAWRRRERRLRWLQCVRSSSSSSGNSARCRLRRNVTARGARRGEASALIVYLWPYLVLVSLHCRLECIMSDWTGQARGGNGT